MNQDIRFYRRRAHEEMAAATRAVTEAARQRRLQLVDLYVRHLEELHQPNPFDEAEFVATLDPVEIRPAVHW